MEAGDADGDGKDCERQIWRTLVDEIGTSSWRRRERRVLALVIEKLGSDSGGKSGELSAAKFNSIGRVDAASR